MRINIWMVCCAILFWTTSCYDVRIKEHPEWDAIFKSHQIEKGTFEYYDNNKEIAHYNNSSFHTDTLVPGAIFNLLHAVIALETGIAPTEQYGMALDSTQQGTTTLVAAMEQNNEAFFSALALKIGEKQMQHALDTVRYGNKAINKQLNAFWENGSLKISPDEMVGFMKRLYHNTLPFNDRAQRIARGMMHKEIEGDYSKYYYQAIVPKDEKTQIVWVVGFIEVLNRLKHVETKKEQAIPHPYFFTLCFETQDLQKDWYKESLVLLDTFINKEGLKEIIKTKAE